MAIQLPTDPPGWVSIALMLLGGFILLAKGADWLVGGGSRMARKFGISVFVIGLTIVSWGTSAPEVVASGVAAYEGSSAMSLGGVLGSNIANLGLVLGASALVLPKVLDTRLQARDLVTFLGSIGVLWWFSLDGEISRVECVVMLFLYGLYTLALLLGRHEGADTDVPESDSKLPDWFETALGFAAVLIGAHLTFQGASFGAVRLGMSERVIGLTVVAIGTSLPELAASLGSAIKGESDLSLGNVIGSNVFNLIVVVGIVGLIRPFEAVAMPDESSREQLAAAFQGALNKDLYVVLGFSLATLLAIGVARGRFGRLKGLLLLTGYVVYDVSLF